MTAAMGGSLEVAVLLRVLERVGINSASFPSCFSLFSSSSIGTLISILSGLFSLLRLLRRCLFRRRWDPKYLGL